MLHPHPTLLSGSKERLNSQSGKESHIGTSHTVVGVTYCREEPLGDRSLSSVGREEIVEDGGVEGTNGSLSEIIVVCLDLG